MHRIDHPTADDTDGVPKFTSGDPAAGAAPTVVTDDWLNDLQENLVHVMTAAGVALTKGRKEDILDAIVAVILSNELTAAEILAKLITVDGAGTDLDADKVDGKHAADFVLATAYTAADVLAKLITVDGPGTGLNADLLDGSHSSAFATSAQGAKADAALPAASYTAADVLAKLKTVDGFASGVVVTNSDQVDGFHGSDLLTDARLSGELYYNITAGSGANHRPGDGRVITGLKVTNEADGDHEVQGFYHRAVQIKAGNGSFVTVSQV